MNSIRCLLGLVLLAGLCAAPAFAAKPKPMTPTVLPVERDIPMAMVFEPDLFVEQEDRLPAGMQTSVDLMMPNASVLSVGAGLAVTAISEGVSMIKAHNDRKRLEQIEAALGRHPWGARLREALQRELSADGLGTGFSYSEEMPRVRVGAKTFDKPGRALGQLRGYVAFSPKLRVIRIFVTGAVEDRRVVRDSTLRLQMERIPHRKVYVEYLIRLPEDVGLSQKKRTLRWAAQDPAMFAQAIEQGIAETARWVKLQLATPERLQGEGKAQRFSAKFDARGKGQLLEDQGERAVLVAKDGSVYAVPKEMYAR